MIQDKRNDGSMAPRTSKRSKMNMMKRRKRNMMKRRLLTLAVMCISALVIGIFWNNNQVDAKVIAVEQKPAPIEANDKITSSKPQEITPVDTNNREDIIKEEIEVKPPVKTSNSNTEEKLPPTQKDLNDILILINKEIGFPSDYKPTDLTVPNVRFSFEGPHEKQNMRKEAAQALESLFKAAEREGFYLYAVSGFRSYSRQQAIYKNSVEKLGQIEADRISAKPGHSEHQTGLAMDITSKGAGFALSEDFAFTRDGEWVAENAHKYGYIIRYEKGKEHLTGYKYEPWHLRYVGADAAKEIYDKDLTLETYLEGKALSQNR
ncbi:LD-carboxypeptidase LdcB, LAS superfamily [Anaerovirgula multivorans]|uniref:LD-carboxypeptidase LdcB, LAS superfamily n=1 Tax=Anaerovirgula multivorans TaxID=312168 RepID=A0A239F7X3_9FIRM|nr:M15 family metallopeptidase [Anaerovirgula multivorans]SNS53130.1 LD-carboxypeptidase LdcB, LAS superfamily [Anaerovirgula multivorans]